MELEQNNSLAKLPLLKQGEYDTWRLRIESYIQLQDYSLWEIIEEGNSFKPVAQTTREADGTSTTTIPGVVTIEEKILKKNDLKARSILMMTLPSEHLLTFNKHKDAKSLFEAIEARFCGNEATKKTQKTLLKQMYETFSASSSESLDSSQSSTNDGNTANVHVSTSSSPVSTASTNNSTACLSDATVYAYLATQPNRSQVVHEDLDQIHEDDLDEMDLKWQLALLSMKARSFIRELKILRFKRTMQESILLKEDINRKKLPQSYVSYRCLDQMIGNQLVGNNKKGSGYNIVPHPLTSLFAPPNVDLSSSGIEKFKEPKFEGYGVKVTKSASENVSKEVKKTSDAPIIEDWVSDFDEDETVLGSKGLMMLNLHHTRHGDLKVLNSPYFMVKSWLVQDQTVLALTIPRQTETGKESSNLFMAGSLPKTISPMIHISQEVILLKEERTINMLVDKKYPLKKEILKKMINLKIEVEEESNMASELIKFIKSQIAEQVNHKFRGGLLGIKELLQDMLLKNLVPLVEELSTVSYSVLGGDTGNESTYSLNKCPGVLGGDTCDGYIQVYVTAS
ncbi:hypothetical protein Tco_1490593 [Tanacetum coccineum]